MNECPALMTIQTAPSLRGQEPIDGSHTGNPLIDIVWSTNPAKRRPDKRASDKDCVMWVGERQVPRNAQTSSPRAAVWLAVAAGSATAMASPVPYWGGAIAATVWPRSVERLAFRGSMLARFIMRMLLWERQTSHPSSHCSIEAGADWGPAWTTDAISSSHFAHRGSK